MITFNYQAVTGEGELRNGVIEAPDRTTAIEQLQRQGLIPMSVDPFQKSTGQSILQMQIRFGRSGQRHTMQFTQDLATLLEAGIALDRALAIMVSVTSDEQSQQLISKVQEGVRKGQALSVALANCPDSFSPFYLNMVQAAEAAGNLSAGLEDLAAYLERSQALRERTLSALIYPMILLLVAGASLTIILVYVVPQFEQLFSDMGQALPLATRIVINTARGLTDYGIWILLFIVALIVYIRHLLKTPAIRLRWDRRSLTLPLWGGLNQRLEIARFSRSLGTLVKAGVPLLNALNIAKDTLLNQALTEEVKLAADSVKEGSTLAEPLTRSKLFPPLMLQMVQVGEETGQLDRMLLRIAEVYDRQVDTAIQRMLTTLEPALIVGLGVMIAGIIMSILVAILSLNQLPV
ncbi:type II secretion system F family protein (plasmid) [Amphritea atlantica]|uniref:Type II secretion system F family protein n=1 Tax=Amphritea atlantica TaxID=355243 RepID=A0ABY5GZZ8_9GAMM|nr:type II secretion system F family protein [Amphritea atlantica]